MATVRFNYLQRFRIALRNIGYSKAEANKILCKIRKNNNSGCFELACERSYGFGDLVSSSFIWEESPEGHNYWKDMFTRLELWE